VSPFIEALLKEIIARDKIKKKNIGIKGSSADSTDECL